MTPNQAAVFSVIERCAATGEPLPSGPQIAERAGLLPTSVGSAIYQLKDAGLISIAKGPHGRRVVTILATGAETGAPAYSGEPALNQPSDSFAAILPAPRDPCWQCGTRADIGCVHTRRAA